MRRNHRHEITFSPSCRAPSCTSRTTGAGGGVCLALVSRASRATDGSPTSSPLWATPILGVPTTSEIDISLAPGSSLLRVQTSIVCQPDPTQSGLVQALRSLKILWPTRSWCVACTSLTRQVAPCRNFVAWESSLHRNVYESISFRSSLTSPSKLYNLRRTSCSHTPLLWESLLYNQTLNSNFWRTLPPSSKEFLILPLQVTVATHVFSTGPLPDLWKRVSARSCPPDTIGSPVRLSNGHRT
jgi:hypothetical protein